MYLIVIIISLIVAFNSIGNIPSGNGMGAIGQAMISLITTFIILLIGHFVSDKLGKVELKIPTYLLVILLVYYYTDRICESKPFALTPSIEIREENQENESIESRKVDKIISKTNLNLQKPEIVGEHKKAIITGVKKLLLRVNNINNENLAFKDTIARFFGWYKFPDIMQDSVYYNWVINYVKNAEQSLECRLIQYSPNQDIFLVYLTYNYSPYDSTIAGNSANCIVYLCYNEKSNISIYPYFEYPSVGDDFPNVNIAFNHVVRYLSNDFGENHFKYKLSHKKFWETRLLKKYNYKSSNFYGFQLKFYQSKGRWDKTPKDSIIGIYAPIFKVSRS